MGHGGAREVSRLLVAPSGSFVAEKLMCILHALAMVANPSSIDDRFRVRTRAAAP